MKWLRNFAANDKHNNVSYKFRAKRFELFNNLLIINNVEKTDILDVGGTNYFWDNTLLGQMIPFSPLGYVNLSTGQQSATYQPGFTGIYAKDIKLPKDGDGPLRLVYSSPSFDVEKGGQIIGVFVYEVNKDYVPLN